MRSNKDDVKEAILAVEATQKESKYNLLLWILICFVAEVVQFSPTVGSYLCNE